MDETTTPPAATDPGAKRAARKGAGKKGGANKEGRAGKLRLRELKVERQAIGKTIQDAKTRKESLDAEIKALRAAQPPKTPKAT
ncbi:MAG: hypothetical protein ACR2F8_07190 [Caulobacteraceae bacterium]